MRNQVFLVCFNKMFIPVVVEPDAVNVNPKYLYSLVDSIWLDL